LEWKGDKVVVVKESGKEAVDFGDLRPGVRHRYELGRFKMVSNRLFLTVAGPPMFIMTTAMSKIERVS
jgi:hypothetical protein